MKLRYKIGWAVSAAAVLASLAGSILVRSYERSDRVYHAMMLRGYGQVPRGASDEFQTRPSDLIFAGSTPASLRTPS